MKKEEQSIKKYRAFIMLGLCAIFCAATAGVYVQAAEETDAAALAEDEILTTLPSDGIYAMGGFSYEVSEEDFDADTEGEILLNKWESDTSAVSEDEQETYASAEEAMEAALDRYETIVEFPTDSSTGPYTVSKSEVSSLVNGFLNSHPEYFYVSQIRYVSLTNGLVKRLIFTYSDSSENLIAMRAAYYQSLETAVSQVDKDRMSGAQICAVIHDYLAVSCDYDNTNADRYNAYGALVEGKAVCQGYALAYQAILNQLGISCITIGSDDMDHAWNMVKLGENYYHVDVTWDDWMTMPGQVYHDNLLLSKAGIEATGHYGYAVENAIKDNTATTYMNEFWKNVYCQIHYYQGALYYIYPENENDMPSVDENQSVAEQFMFVKKPTGDTDSQNIELFPFTFAVLEGDELTELFQRLKSYVRLVCDADTWYINTAYGIYSVDISEAAAATEDNIVNRAEVYRLPETPEDDTITYGSADNAGYPIINGLWCDQTTLYYRTEGGTLTAVPELTLSEPETESLYLYEGGSTLVLSLNEEYQLHPFWLPQNASPVLAYTSSASNYVSVDSSTGLLKANAYTHGNPVTITVLVPGTSLTTTVQVEVAHINVTGIMLSNANITLAPGETKQLKACVTPGNATCQDITYSVYSMESVQPNQAVVKVDETGLVTALNSGTAVVRAKIEDYLLKADGSKESTTYYVDCRVDVVVKPTALTLSTKAMDLKVGGMQQLSYVFTPANTSNQAVTFSSSNTSVATVTAQGIVKAQAAGTAVITVTAAASTADGTILKGSCTVTVTKADVATTQPATPSEVKNVQGITLNKNSLSMKTLNVKTLTATITPSTAANKNIIWTSSDNSVATVTEISGTAKAEVKAIGVGTAVIRATTVEGAYVAGCTVTVGARSIAKAVTTKIAKKSYTGKAIKPAVTVVLDGVKLKKNKDYKITYKNNKKVGTATITIKGTGSYTGTKKITFSIVPRTPSAKVKGGNKAVLITYSKVAEADGYQIIYAKNKTFTKAKKKKNINQNRIFATSITGLSAKTTYYVKIRSYKVVNKKKVYSNYYYIGKVKTK